MLPCKRRKFQPYEVPLVMLADGANLRCRTSLFNMPAVKAHPLTCYVGNKQLALLQKDGQTLEKDAIVYYDLESAEVTE